MNCIPDFPLFVQLVVGAVVGGLGHLMLAEEAGTDMSGHVSDILPVVVERNLPAGSDMCAAAGLKV